MYCFTLTLSDIEDMTKSTCTLVWTPPSDDGGSEITKYTVERREMTRHVWTLLSKCVKADVLRFEVDKLMENREYEFQVLQNLFFMGY